MSIDDMTHVAYLGAFVVAGKLYRGDLYRDAKGRYWAEHSLTEPNGAWMTALHHVVAESGVDAAIAALAGMMEYLRCNGDDVSNMTIVHYRPPMEALTGLCGSPVSQFH